MAQIKLSDINTKVSNLSGEEPITPITMSGLNQKIDEAIASGKDWAIYTVSFSSGYTNNLTIDEKFSNANIAIISLSMYVVKSKSYVKFNVSNNNNGQINLTGDTNYESGETETTPNIKINNNVVTISSGNSYYKGNFSLTFIVYK